MCFLCVTTKKTHAIICSTKVYIPYTVITCSIYYICHTTELHHILCGPMSSLQICVKHLVWPRSLLKPLGRHKAWRISRSVRRVSKRNSLLSFSTKGTQDTLPCVPTHVQTQVSHTLEVLISHEGVWSGLLHRPSDINDMYSQLISEWQSDSRTY